MRRPNEGAARPTDRRTVRSPYRLPFRGDQPPTQAERVRKRAEAFNGMQEEGNLGL